MTGSSGAGASSAVNDRIVFVDRDGVINVDPIGDYVKSWEEFRFEPGSLEALAEIRKLNYDIIIISNQAGVGDGVYPEAALWDVHRRMMQELEQRGIRIRSVHYCLHGKLAGCRCRKPQTGLFEEATRGLRFNPSETFFIGDKGTDVEAGKRFGLRTILVRTGHGRLDESRLRDEEKPDFLVDNLGEAVKILRS